MSVFNKYRAPTDRWALKIGCLLRPFVASRARSMLGFGALKESGDWAQNASSVCQLLAISADRIHWCSGFGNRESSAQVLTLGNGMGRAATALKSNPAHPVQNV